MNQNMASAVLLIVIAAAGIAWSSPAAVLLVILTCVLTVLVEQCRAVSAAALFPALGRVEFILALASWFTALVAIVALFA